MKEVKKIILLIALVMLCGCGTTVINKSPNAIALQTQLGLGVVPMENHTQTPQAGEKVASIVAGVLQTKGANNIKIYKQNVPCDKILACPSRNLNMSEVLRWARKSDIGYIILGTVNEWSYKVGLDGEPTVNITLKLIKADSGKTIWNAVGSKVGGSRSGLGDIGHELIAKILSSVKIYN